MNPASQIRTILLVFTLLSLTGAGCTQKASRERHLSRGDQYFQNREFEKASIEYLNVLRLDPTSVDAIRKLGFCHFERGHFGQALPFLIQAKVENPRDLEVRTRLGRIYEAQQAVGDARKEALSILEQDPKNALGLMMLIETQTTPEEREADREWIARFRQQGGNEAAALVAEGTGSLYGGDYAAAEGIFERAVTADAQFSRAHFALGFARTIQGKMDEAATCYQTAAELAPTNWFERLKWAEFKVRTGAVGDGKKLLEDLITQAPDFTAAKTVLALVAFDQKQYSECSRLTKAVLAQNPDNFAALLLLAKISAVEADSKQAMVDFQRLAESHPRSAQAQYELAVALAREGETAKAISRLNEAVSLDRTHLVAQRLLGQLSLRNGDTSNGLRLLDSLAAQNPRDWQSQLSLAEAYRMAGKSAEVLAVYRNLEQLFPDKPQVPFLMGVTERSEGRPAEARASFQRALRLSPHFLPAASQLLEIHLGAKELAAAQELIDGLLQAAPEAGEVHFLVARVRFAQTRNTEGEAALLKAVELDPQLTSATGMLAQFYIGMKRHGEALERLESLIQANPGNLGALSQAGMLHEYMKQYDKAAQKYELVLAAAPEAHLVRNNLAYLYAERLGQLDKGYALASRARTQLPENPLIADTLGWVNFRRGEYVQSLPLLRMAAAALPAQPIVQYHLGMAHYMMGDEDLARRTLEKSLASGRDFEHSGDTKQRLAILRFDVSKPDAAMLRELESRKEDPVALLRLARVSEKNGDLDHAASLYERVLTVNSSATPAMLALARIYSSATDEKRERALKLAKAALPLSGDEPQTLALLGRSMCRAGDPGSALPLLEMAASKLPMDLALEYDTAMCIYLTGAVAKAVKQMENLRTVAADSPAAQSAKEFLFWAAEIRKPRIDPSLADRIKATLQTMPDYLPARHADALLRSRGSKPGEARIAFDAILKTHPEFAPARRDLALLLGRLGADKEADPMLTQFLRDTPSDLEVAAALGRSKYRNKNLEAAASTLASVVSHRPEDAESRFYLGMSYRGLKRPAQAEQHLKKALELGLGPALMTEANRVLYSNPGDQ